MANYNKKISDTCVRLGEVRFSYAHVFEPRQSDNGGEPKYSVCILIPKTDKATVELVREAVAAAEEKGKTSKWGGKLPAKRGNPLRDGDEEEKGPEYEGMYFVNASSKQKPGVRVLEGGKVVEALDTEDFYSGCWGAVTVIAGESGCFLILLQRMSPPARSAKTRSARKSGTIRSPIPPKAKKVVRNIPTAVARIMPTTHGHNANILRIFSNSPQSIVGCGDSTHRCRRRRHKKANPKQSELHGADETMIFQ